MVNGKACPEGSSRQNTSHCNYLFWSILTFHGSAIFALPEMSGVSCRIRMNRTACNILCANQLIWLRASVRTNRPTASMCTNLSATGSCSRLAFDWYKIRCICTIYCWKGDKTAYAAFYYIKKPLDLYHAKRWVCVHRYRHVPNFCSEFWMQIFFNPNK